jgi:hypothetical protein
MIEGLRKSITKTKPAKTTRKLNDSRTTIT